ncbi:ATP-NAD/AcoX kinase, partial [Burkholderia sp. TJI49]
MHAKRRVSAGGGARVSRCRSPETSQRIRGIRRRFDLAQNGRARPPRQHRRGCRRARGHHGTPLAEMTGKSDAVASATTIRSPATAADETDRPEQARERRTGALDGDKPVTTPVTVGVIANPASGRDIRRLTTHASVFPTAEKANMIVRLLAGLGAMGVERVLTLRDRTGIATLLLRAIDTHRAVAPHERWPEVEFVDLPITG